MMNKWLVLMLMLLSGALGWYLAGHWPLQQQPTVSQDVLAVVGDEVITKDEFIKQMSSRGGSMPGQYHELRQKQFLLDFMINQQVMFDDAVRQGIDQDEAVEKICRKATIDKYLELELNQKLKTLTVSEREIQQHFDNNKQRYEKPARKRAAIIYKRLPAAASEAVKQELVEEMRSVKDQVAELDDNILHFGELALSHSDDRNSKYQGGVVGWFVEHPQRAYKWDRVVIETLFALPQAGAVSDVLETDDGLFLVRLVAAEQVEEKTLSQVSSGIRQQLLKAKQDALKKQFITQLIESTDIDINQQLLANINPLNPEQQTKQKKPPALPGDNGSQP